MKSKNLIIAFISISTAALIVSSFAVFTVARVYIGSLDSGTEGTDAPPETSLAPDLTESLPTVNGRPETETTEETDGVGKTDGNTDTEAAASPEETGDIQPSGFILTLAKDRLVIVCGSEKLYERIIDGNDIRENDRKRLQKGIEFNDLDSAMSAVYDLIS